MEKGFYHPTRGYWQTNTDPDKTIRDQYPNGTVEVPLIPGSGYEWNGSQWIAPPEPSAEELLTQERAEMVCTPAQMRLALLASGELQMVQQIADADPAASIVWEYATQIVRNSPLISALGGENGFTPEQIDGLFRAAMQIET